MFHSMDTIPSVDGYFGYLHLLPVVHDAALNISEQVLVWSYIFASVRYTPGLTIYMVTKFI